MTIGIVTANTIFHILNKRTLEVTEMSFSNVANAIRGGLDIADVDLYVDPDVAKKEAKHLAEARQIGRMCENLPPHVLEHVRQIVMDAQIRDPAEIRDGDA